MTPLPRGGGSPASPAPSYPGMTPLPYNPNSQDRINGLGGELQNDANQYGVQAYNTHWNDLTKGIGTGSAVDAFAKQYGVTRGVGQLGGVQTPQSDADLLQAAKQAYQPQFQQTILSKDPNYIARISGMSPTSINMTARRQGVMPLAVDAQQAQVQGMQNADAQTSAVTGGINANTARTNAITPILSASGNLTNDAISIANENAHKRGPLDLAAEQNKVTAGDIANDQAKQLEQSNVDINKGKAAQAQAQGNLANNPDYVSKTEHETLKKRYADSQSQLLAAQRALLGKTGFGTSEEVTPTYTHYSTNPKTGQRMGSNDGKTWQVVK